MSTFSYGNHLFADIHPDLLKHANDVSLRRGVVRAKHEIGGGKEKKVDIVVFYIKRIVMELPYQFGSWCRLNPIQVIKSLRRRHIMRGRAYTADIGHYPRHLLRRPADTEPFKTPRFDYLKVSILHIPFVI